MLKGILKKTLLSLLVILFFVNWNSCFDKWLEPVMDLDVPYCPQEEWNYCGIACIQMWAKYENPDDDITQEGIADWIGVGKLMFAPERLADGVRQLAFRPHAFLAMLSSFQPGVEGDLVGMAVTGIYNMSPSIIPWAGNHAVIIKGYRYREKEIYDDYGNLIDIIPIATRIRYHDPDPLEGADRELGKDSLFERYVPDFATYWMIIGDRSYMQDGIDGHNDFIRLGGTYYGGPLNYNPKLL